MHSTNCRKFKGEVEKYLPKVNIIFESRMDRIFRMLNIKIKLNQNNIRKKGRLSCIAPIVHALSFAPVKDSNHP